jgi:hypothetical protein
MRTQKRTSPLCPAPKPVGLLVNTQSISPTPPILGAVPLPELGVAHSKELGVVVQLALLNSVNAGVTSCTVMFDKVAADGLLYCIWYSINVFGNA